MIVFHYQIDGSDNSVKNQRGRDAMKRVGLLKHQLSACKQEQSKVFYSIGFPSWKFHTPSSEPGLSGRWARPPLFLIAHWIRKVWLTVKPQLKQPGMYLLYFRIQTASAASCHLCHNSEKRPVIWSDISIINNSNSHNFLNKGKFMTTVLSNEQRLE